MSEMFKEFAERVVQATKGIGGFVAVTFDEAEPRQPASSWQLFKFGKCKVYYGDKYYDDKLEYVSISDKTHSFCVTKDAIIKKVLDDASYFWPEKPDGFVEYIINNPNDPHYFFRVSIMNGKRLFHKEK